MKRLIAVLAVAAALAAIGQNTVRRGLRAESRPETTQTGNTAPAYDTIVAAADGLVDIKGYDKPLRSRRETFFVTNEGKSPIARMAVTLTYLDAKGRQLHRRSYNLAADIPPGETRQIGLRSWDTQQSFYYTRSEVPVRAAQATPFDVAIAVDTLFCELH